MKRTLLTTAALAAAVAVLTALSLPRPQISLDRSWTDASVPGILHIHTSRSDGRGSPDEIAAAAARAGLKFIVLTDHGDATRQPDPPVYRSGVLCIDAVEISTSGGHVVALDLPAAPYPLAGEPRDVVDDIHRLGGFADAAHPDSPKNELRWTDWDAPIDGLELINPDTSWRVRLFTPGAESRLSIVRGVLAYPWRPAGTIADLLTDAPELQARWTALAARGARVGLAGADAHAKLAFFNVDPGDNRYSLPIPSYESSFRTLSVHVTPKEPLSGDAAADARNILDAIRRGSVYVAIDAWASPPAFEFTASNQHGAAQPGEDLEPGGPVTLHVRSNAPQSFTTTIWRNAEPVSVQPGASEIAFTADDQPAVYRVDIRSNDRDGRPAWLFSNPIYVRHREPLAAPRPMEAQAGLSLFDGRSTAGWTTESDSTSAVALESVPLLTGASLRLRFGLAGGSLIGQYAGAVVETHGVADYTRVAFTLRAEHPQRISVQMRSEVDGEATDRWQRSIYVDETDRDHTVRFDDMRPIGSTRSVQADLRTVRALMFVVDTTNTKPGTSGRVWIKNVRLER